MGFFHSSSTSQSIRGRRKENRISVETLHKKECSVCPLNRAAAYNPKMQPSGSTKPVVYCLGEAPGENEDRRGEPFVGKAGRFLRKHFSPEDLELVRFGNCVRTRPPNNRDPSWQEIECCRPSVARDIAETQPMVIFGFGNIPLFWATGESGGITKWRGRRLPISVLGHKCWFYPMLHPSYVNRMANSRKAEEAEWLFKLDIKRAMQDLENWVEPVVWNPKTQGPALTLVTGDEPGALETVRKMLADFMQEPAVGIDIETKGLVPHRDGAKILSAAVGTNDKVVAFALDHKQMKWDPKSRVSVGKLLKDFLINYQGVKVAQNSIFEIEWLEGEFGDDIVRLGREGWEDSMAQAYILDSRKGMLNLGVLTKLNLGFDVKDLSKVNVNNLDNEPILDVLRYNSLDIYCLPVWELQNERLKKAGLYDVYKFHNRRIATLAHTQRLGLEVSFGAVERHKDELQSKVNNVLDKIFELDEVGEFQSRYGQFSPSSNPNLAVMFRDLLGFKQGATEDEKYSTKEEVLERIDHPLAQLILDYRDSTKLLGTYVLGLSEEDGKYVCADKKVHPRYNPNYTSTGRLSSEMPNIQNFPKRQHQEIRDMICAPPGFVMLSADYGQIEARVIAMASKDKTLVAALWEGYDIHAEWAKRLALEYPKVVGGKKFLNDKDVLKKWRSVVKNGWTFPLFFGSVARSVAGDLGIPLKIIDPLYNEFWTQFADVKKWHKKLEDGYWRRGYVEMLTGRRRNAPIERNKIINNPIQGTASDIVVDAMDELSVLSLQVGDPQLHPIMNVHDDLEFYVEENRLEEIADRVTQVMCTPRWSFINVPLSVELAVGDDWHSLKDVVTITSQDLGYVRTRKGMELANEQRFR